MNDPKHSEKWIEKQVASYCQKQKLICRKFSSPMCKGVPDRIIMGFGRVLFLELKSKGKKPTNLQQIELALYQANGLCAAWADNFETAKQLIDKYVINGDF